MTQNRPYSVWGSATLHNYRHDRISVRKKWLWTQCPLGQKERFLFLAAPWTWSDSLSIPNDGQRHNNGNEILCVSALRAEVSELAFGRLGIYASWLSQLDCGVLIGAGGSVGALIGRSACRLLACARAAIENTRAGASGSLQAATTNTSVVVIVVEASAPKVYPRVALASVSTLSGSVVRTLKGGEGHPNMFCRVASSLGHLRS